MKNNSLASVLEMRSMALQALAALVCALAAPTVWAKLPPLSDEAKAKADETAAKTAHQGKVDSFLLCKSMDKVAARYQAEARRSGKAPKPTAGLPPCADPGKFVYTPPSAATTAKAVTTAAAATPAKK